MVLPAEARDGLSRVWLEILKEKHPDVGWVLSSDDELEPGDGQKPDSCEELEVAA